MKILRLIASICLFLLFSGTASAEDKSRILLINSDASVEKYKEAQEEFKKALARPVQEIHLEEKKWNLPEVEDFLWDEDPDLVYCIGSKAYLVANKYVGNKDIIFSSVINWQRLKDCSEALDKASPVVKKKPSTPITTSIVSSWFQVWSSAPG